MAGCGKSQPLFRGRADLQIDNDIVKNPIVAEASRQNHRALKRRNRLQRRPSSRYDGDARFIRNRHAREPFDVLKTQLASCPTRSGRESVSESRTPHKHIRPSSTSALRYASTYLFRAASAVSNSVGSPRISMKLFVYRLASATPSSSLVGK